MRDQRKHIERPVLRPLIGWGAVVVLMGWAVDKMATLARQAIRFARIDELHPGTASMRVADEIFKLGWILLPAFLLVVMSSVDRRALRAARVVGVVMVVSWVGVLLLTL